MSETKRGICDKCRKKADLEHPYRVVKVLDLKSGKVEWRCNNCVRYLSDDGETAHKLSVMQWSSY